MVLILLVGGFTVLAQSQHEHSTQAEKATMTPTNEDTIQQMNECRDLMQKMMQTLESGEQITLEQMREMMETMMSHQMMMHQTMGNHGMMGHEGMISKSSSNCPMMKGKAGSSSSPKMQCSGMSSKVKQGEKSTESGHESHKH